jgi:hypothetical protein
MWRKQRAEERTECNRRTEGCRADRGLLRIQSAIERIEGRKGGRGPWRGQRAIEGAERHRGASEHTYSNNHFAIIALIYLFTK